MLNILVLAGFGIAASGWGLSRREQMGPGPAWIDSISPSRPTGMYLLIGLLALAYFTMRFGSSRAALTDPRKRAGRFFRSRVVATAIASLAIPLGFLSGWVSGPDLQTVAPYWIASLGMGFIALPRGHELDDFDEPISPSVT